MHTTQLIEALEEAASRQGLIAHEMMRDVRERQGGEIIGVSPTVTRLREEVTLIAPSTFTVLRAVRACDGNWSAAARELGMDRSNLHHLARRLGLDVAK
jgi:transcriptional regulator with GAF, ATPase, and Fis domain